MSRHYFILPDGETGDAVFEMHIADGAAETPVVNVSADAVMKMIRDNERLEKQARMFADALERERGRIQRLMRAIADEVCNPA